VGKILGDFSGSLEPVRILYIEIKGDFIFDLRIFTLRTFFIERITFVNRGMGVYIFVICHHIKCHVSRRQLFHQLSSSPPKYSLKYFNQRCVLSRYSLRSHTQFQNNRLEGATAVSSYCVIFSLRL
jgi:hypothetical protein